MRLRKIDIIILLSIGILLIARSIWGIAKDINIDLSKADSISGIVSQAQIIKIKEATLRLTKYKKVFAIQLDNSTEKFAVDRGLSICDFLKSEIEIGDSIQIYYRSGTGDFNTHIFQIEKGNFVLINSTDYSKKEGGMIVLALIFGSILIVGTILWIVKKRKSQNLINSN